ncbi:hypothetical protein [Methanolapillus millepedarum]
MISVNRLKRQIIENKFVKAEITLLLALMLFNFIPGINQLIVDRLLSGLESNVLNIAGQIEWFDLINETLLAFLTIPLYFLFNEVAKDKEIFKSRIVQVFTIGFLLYLAAAIVVYLYAGSLSIYMNAPPESTLYLQMETIGFIAGFVSSFMYVVFVVRGNWKYIISLLIAKVVMLSIGNVFLIPDYGVLGLATTNIMCNIILSAVSIFLLYKDGLLQTKISFEKKTLQTWARVGLFSGGQIFLDNLIYMLIVCKMVNAVSSAGVYWLANNFIWGWLLIPIAAFAEIVKRDYTRGYSRIYNYILFVAGIAVLWLLSFPLWSVMFEDVIHAQEPQVILDILYMLVPFYVAYALATVFDGVLVSVGKTRYLFANSILVNIGYYGIVYLLFLTGVFTASIPFIVMMFGFGMFVHLIFSIVFFWDAKRKFGGQGKRYDNRKNIKTDVLRIRFSKHDMVMVLLKKEIKFL